MTSIRVRPPLCARRVARRCKPAHRTRTLQAKSSSGSLDSFLSTSGVSTHTLGTCSDANPKRMAPGAAARSGRICAHNRANRQFTYQSPVERHWFDFRAEAHRQFVSDAVCAIRKRFPSTVIYTTRTSSERSLMSLTAPIIWRERNNVALPCPHKLRRRDCGQCARPCVALQRQKHLLAVGWRRAASAHPPILPFAKGSPRRVRFGPASLKLPKSATNQVQPPIQDHGAVQQTYLARHAA